jgi:IS605 OrfB family transposase
MNEGKQASLDSLFIDYKHDLEIYINYIIDGILPLKPNLSSSLLPTERISHSRYKQLIYKQASEIIRSQIDKAKKKRFNNYKKIYSYMMKNHPDSSFIKLKFSELSLNDILKTKYFTIPNLNNLSINLDERFFDIKQNAKHFDNYLKLILPYFNDKGTRALQVKIPFNNHNHSNNFKDSNFLLRSNIQLKKVNGVYYVSQIWYKEVDKKNNGKAIAFDMGYNKLLVSSDNEHIGVANMKSVYDKISRKKQGSKAFKRSLIQRDNLINESINKIDLSPINQIILEDLVNVKSGKKYFNNKIQRWSYAKTIDKINRTCEVKGIELVKVSPAYTSQTCSNCGEVDKKSRLGETFKCTSCSYEIDSDYNGAINIYNKGTIVPLITKKLNVNTFSNYWWV